jgi:hypothetical protein
MSTKVAYESVKGWFMDSEIKCPICDVANWWSESILLCVTDKEDMITIHVHSNFEENDIVEVRVRLGESVGVIPFLIAMNKRVRLAEPDDFRLNVGSDRIEIDKKVRYVDISKKIFCRWYGTRGGCHSVVCPEYEPIFDPTRIV